jgi:hypothetical protein
MIADVTYKLPVLIIARRLTLVVSLLFLPAVLQAEESPDDAQIYQQTLTASGYPTAMAAAVMLEDKAISSIEVEYAPTSRNGCPAFKARIGAETVSFKESKPRRNSAGNCILRKEFGDYWQPGAGSMVFAPKGKTSLSLVSLKVLYADTSEPEVTQFPSLPEAEVTPSPAPSKRSAKTRGH